MAGVDAAVGVQPRNPGGLLQGRMAEGPGDSHHVSLGNARAGDRRPDSRQGQGHVANLYQVMGFHRAKLYLARLCLGGTP